MSEALSPMRPGHLTGSVKRIAGIAAVVLVLIAMALGTKVVDLDSTVGSGPQKFDPATYGATEFPKVQTAVEKRAAPAGELASALRADQAAATAKYGVPASPGPEMAVSFTGVVGKADGGIATVKIDGLPPKLVVRLQVGPAINGTDLRDAIGTVTFGQFVNQIDYQNAASALNDQMKQQVLAPLGDGVPAGKTISVVGVFPLINPDGWLVTPTKLGVQ